MLENCRPSQNARNVAVDDPYSIEVIVRGSIKDGYRLKVSFTVAGMYIDGFTARRSSRNSSGWWIQSPAFREINWKNVPEFNKKGALWLEIERRCIEAVEAEEAFTPDVVAEVTAEDLTEEGITKNLDKAVEQLGLIDGNDQKDKDEPKAISWLKDED